MPINSYCFDYHSWFAASMILYTNYDLSSDEKLQNSCKTVLIISRVNLMSWWNYSNLFSWTAKWDTNFNRRCFLGQMIRSLKYSSSKFTAKGRKRDYLTKRECWNICPMSTFSRIVSKNFYFKDLFLVIERDVSTKLIRIFKPSSAKVLLL